MVAIHKENVKPFVVSAPGKVILFGEHAVVYGKTAIASSLDMRAYALVAPRKDGKVRVLLPDVNVDIVFGVEALARVDVSGLDHPTEIEALVPEAIEIPDGPGRTAVLSFVYLYSGIFVGTTRPSAGGFSVCVRSLLPVGSGLGSSAALNVTLSAALLRISGRIGPHAETEEEKQLVNEWAFRGEQVAHGTPSGIDNAVATYGGFLRYTKGQTPVSLASTRALDVLITNTNVPKSTKGLVAGVRTLRDRFPAIIDPVLDSIHAISMRAADLFQSAGDASDGSADAQQQIEELETQLRDIIGLNHALLSALGVSHPSLERIREITASANLASKLTGAGGGGCALTLVPQSAAGSKTEAKAVSDLENEGFQCYRTAVGGPGVSIAYEVGSESVERWVGNMLERHMSLVPSSHLSSSGSGGDAVARPTGENDYAGIVSGFSILPSSVMTMLSPAQLKL